MAKHNGPFAWGTRDCATLFREAVEAVTGDDPLAGFAPWRSEQDAMRRLAQSGCTSVLDFVAARFTEIEPADARRGDLVFAAETTLLTCPAVIVGSMGMSLTETGVLLFPRSLGKRAFLVGL